MTLENGGCAYVDGVGSVGSFRLGCATQCACGFAFVLFAWLCSSTRDARSGSFVFLSFVQFLRLQGELAGSASVGLVGIKRRASKATLLFGTRLLKQV